MRDYSKVSGSFWTGKTGRSLRGDFQAQVVAMYLMTSPHANMIGVFHCPVLYIAHETGSPLEGAREGLQRLIEGGFCTYDDDTETVWVHQMANYQIGEALKANDNRVKDIRKQYENLPESCIKHGFFNKYREAFHLLGPLENDKPLGSPLEAPPKPEAVTEAGTGTGLDTPVSPKPPPVKNLGSRLPADWQLTDELREFCADRRPDLDPEIVAMEFKNYWLAKSGKDASKLRWDLTWQNWVIRSHANPAFAKPSSARSGGYAEVL